MIKKIARKVLPKKWMGEETIIPVVRLKGVIGEGSKINPGLNLEAVNEQLESAFENKSAPAIGILVNSPGGSPVQSRQIYLRIRQLAALHNKQVLVFVEDVAASGGYMIALAGDEIFVDPASIIGSIGVVSSGFGFTSLIEKIGVERRVYTAGKKKVTLDPFAPEVAEDVEHLKTLQREIHDLFITMVKERRGDVLAQDDDIFSGLFWTGEKAQQLGLVDGIEDVYGLLQKRYGDKVKVKYEEASKGFISKLIGAHSEKLDLRSGVQAMPDAAIQSLEERTIRARYEI
ncbi:S49 family peptidase [Polycladidibacter stylochi]|uniref:S49 family peptidase n=1 Tax=Polycladidibacter stylochi TaxID=1807766 RepID=UPI00082EBA23|nr:S49 family peptidase [Pseudovibrio stylochi]